MSSSVKFLLTVVDVDGFDTFLLTFLPTEMGEIVTSVVGSFVTVLEIGVVWTVTSPYLFLC